MNRVLAILAFVAIGIGFGHAQDEYDDIYFNPKKDAKPEKQVRQQSSANGSNYVADFGSVDVDAYNRRGEFYYTSPIDTVGVHAGTGDDFVYTQQIQKFYNPTIVVDNAEILQDVLANSYGNVEIVYDGFSPVFLPSYYRFYSAWPYYSYGWYNPWSYTYYGPSWSWNWGWGPSWSWGYPYYGYGWGYPHYGWGWTSPGWGWGWSPERERRWMANHYRPHGNNTVGARPGWSGTSRPVNNGYMGNMAHRRGSSSSAGYRPATTSYSTNNHRTTGVSNGINTRPGTTQYRQSGTTTNTHRYTTGGTTTNRYNGAVNSKPNRYGGSTGANSYKGNKSTTTTRPASNNNHRSNSGFSSGSHRSSGGSGTLGGSRSSGGSRGGGGGGRHR